MKLQTPDIFPPIGKEILIDFGEAVFKMLLLSATSARMTMVRGATAGASEDINITITSLRDGQYAVTWQRTDKTTVVHIHDYIERSAHSFVTRTDGQFLHLQGQLTVEG